MVKQDRTCLDGMHVEPMKCLWPVCDDDILNALESLDHRDLSQEGYNQFERFVCHIYTSNVNDFRWSLYFNNAAEGRVFPSTTGSLTMHVQRAHYVAMIRRKAGEAIRAFLLRSIVVGSLT